MKYELKEKWKKMKKQRGNGVDFEPITAGRMFMTSRARHYDLADHPITRITNQMGNLNDVVWGGLWGVGVRTPDGVWGWLGRKRRELEARVES